MAVDSIPSLNLNHWKCFWVQCGNHRYHELLDCFSINCGEFPEMKIVKHCQYVGTMIRPEGHLHGWTAPRKKKTFKRLGKSTRPPKSWSNDWMTSKYIALSVLGTNICLVSAGYIGSISALGEATLKEESHATMYHCWSLQCYSY